MFFYVGSVLTDTKQSLLFKELKDYDIEFVRKYYFSIHHPYTIHSVSIHHSYT